MDAQEAVAAARVPQRWQHGLRRHTPAAHSVRRANEQRPAYMGLQPREQPLDQLQVRAAPAHRQERRRADLRLREPRRHRRGESERGQGGQRKSAARDMGLRCRGEPMGEAEPSARTRPVRQPRAQHRLRAGAERGLVGEPHAPAAGAVRAAGVGVSVWSAERKTERRCIVRNRHATHRRGHHRLGPCCEARRVVVEEFSREERDRLPHRARRC